MQGPPQIHVSPDVYLELPPEHILSALGTNYNALVRTWTLRQYQLHLEHHQKMAHYYQQCIRRFEDLEVRYEREPEQPIAPVTAGPIKLSDLAKQRPQATKTPPQSIPIPPAPVPTSVPTPAPVVQTPPPVVASSGPSSNIKSFDSSNKSGTALSSSLAAKDVKLDKKAKPIKVDVQLDAEEREALTQPEIEHFSRPRVKRAANNQRSDIKKLVEVKNEDEISTWQENPQAFSGGAAKDSKIKSAFSGLKSSLFSKKNKEEDEDKDRESSSTITTVTTDTTSQPYFTPASPPPITPQYGTNQFGTNQFGTSSGPPPLKTGPPPLNPAGGGGPPPAPINVGTAEPGRLFIPPPPATPTFGPK